MLNMCQISSLMAAAEGPVAEFSSFANFEEKKRKSRVLTIYMGKPEIPVGKSNGSRHSVWEASENMDCGLR